VASARRALAINARCGETLRRRLACNVSRFRAGLRRHGLSSRGGPGPVQTLDAAPGIDAADLNGRLAAAGIETVLRSTRVGPRVSFLITALHEACQIDRAVAALAAAGDRLTRGGALCPGL
jgi:8-amino-7-oxononanoate synthase